MNKMAESLEQISNKRVVASITSELVPDELASSLEREKIDLTNDKGIKYGLITSRKNRGDKLNEIREIHSGLTNDAIKELDNRRRVTVRTSLYDNGKIKVDLTYSMFIERDK